MFKVAAIMTCAIGLCDAGIEWHESVVGGVGHGVLGAKAATDGDGLWDGWNVTVKGHRHLGELAIHFLGVDMNNNNTVTDPGDIHPQANHTDPLNADSDGDGLSDGEEVANGGIISDPLVPDTDGDGLSDFEEVKGVEWTNGYSGETETVTTSPADPDTDGDGLNDYLEVTGWDITTFYEATGDTKAEYHVTTNPLAPTTYNDGDGLNDYEEFLNGTDPYNSDTDGDGKDDSEEIAEGVSPLGVECTTPYITKIKTWGSDPGFGWATLHVRVNASDIYGLKSIKIEIKSNGKVVHHKTWEFSEDDKPTTQAEKETTYTVWATNSYDVYAYTWDRNGNEIKSKKIHIGSAGEALTNAVAAVVQMIADALNRIVQIIKDLITKILTRALEPVWNAYNSWIDGIVRVCNKYMPEDPDAEYTGQDYSIDIDAFKDDLGHALLGSFWGLLKSVSNVIQGFFNIIKPFLDVIQDILQTVVDTISSVIMGSHKVTGEKDENIKLGMSGKDLMRYWLIIVGIDEQTQDAIAGELNVDPSNAEVYIFTLILVGLAILFTIVSLGLGVSIVSPVATIGTIICGLFSFALSISAFSPEYSSQEKANVLLLSGVVSLLGILLGIAAVATSGNPAQMFISGISEALSVAAMIISTTKMAGWW